MSENQITADTAITSGPIVAVFGNEDGDSVRAEFHLKRIQVCLRTCAGVDSEELENLPVGLNVILPSMDGLASLVKSLFSAANHPDPEQWLNAKSQLVGAVAGIRDAANTH